MGILSAAAITNGFHGYLAELLPVTRIPTITVTVVVMTGLAIWGVNAAVGAAVLVTFLELADRLQIGDEGRAVPALELAGGARNGGRDTKHEDGESATK